MLGFRFWALGPLTKLDLALGLRIWALGPLTKLNQMKLPAFVRHFRLLFSLLRLCLINHDKQSFFFSSFLLFFFCHRSQIKIRLPYPLAIASVSFCFFHFHFLFPLILNFLVLRFQIVILQNPSLLSLLVHAYPIFWILCLFFVGSGVYFLVVFFFFQLLGPFVRSVNLEEIELVHLLFHCGTVSLFSFERTAVFNIGTVV